MFQTFNEAVHQAVQPNMMKCYLFFHLILIFYHATDNYLYEFIKIIQLLAGLTAFTSAIVGVYLRNNIFIYPILLDSCARFIFFVFGMGLWAINEFLHTPEKQFELFYKAPSVLTASSHSQWKMMHFLRSSIVIIFYELMFITSLLFIKLNSSKNLKNECDAPPLYHEPANFGISPFTGSIEEDNYYPYMCFEVYEQPLTVRLYLEMKFLPTSFACLFLLIAGCVLYFVFHDYGCWLCSLIEL